MIALLKGFQRGDGVQETWLLWRYPVPCLVWFVAGSNFMRPMWVMNTVPINVCWGHCHNNAWPFGGIFSWHDLPLIISRISNYITHSLWFMITLTWKTVVCSYLSYLRLIVFLNDAHKHVVLLWPLRVYGLVLAWNDSQTLTLLRGFFFVTLYYCCWNWEFWVTYTHTLLSCVARTLSAIALNVQDS